MKINLIIFYESESRKLKRQIIIFLQIGGWKNILIKDNFTRCYSNLKRLGQKIKNILKQKIESNSERNM